MKQCRKILPIFAITFIALCSVIIVRHIYSKGHTPQEVKIHSGPSFAELIPHPDIIRYYHFGTCMTISDLATVDSIFSDIQNGLKSVSSMAGLDYVESELDVTMDTGEVLELLYDEPVYISWEMEGLGSPIECNFTTIRLILDGGRGIGRRGNVFCGTGTPIPFGVFTISDSLQLQLDAFE